MYSGMHWVVKWLDDVYKEHGTTPVRRFVLAFLCGSAVGFLAYRKYKLSTPEETSDTAALLMTLGFGLETAVVGALLPAANRIFNVLWKGGVIRKFFVFVLILILGWFFMGTIALIYLWATEK